MRYTAPDKDIFIQNRNNFTAELPRKAIALFTSNDVPVTNGDGVLPFKQNSDLFYLSGIDQEDTFLLLFPDAINKKHREILFLRETNPFVATWEGKKLSMAQAKDLSGIETVYWESDFYNILESLIFQAETIFLNSNEHPRASRSIETRVDRFNKEIKDRYPLHNIGRSAPVLHHLRQVKSSGEIAVMQKAIDITEKAFRRVLKEIRPGRYEYEIEAELTHEFIRNGSSGHSYSPIIASGADSCVLHYISNDKKMEDGGVVLMDFGAEYANYDSDLTRTVPVNGKFTQRQKDVYNSVLHVLKEATKLLTPGTLIPEYQEEVGKMISEELIKLNVLTREQVDKQDPKKPLYKKYFMHGTSHSIGLDTHDVDDRYRPIQPGMIFTCEPGIYLKEEGIGVRLENDILITKGGPINLMKTIPIEVEEIEELMAEQ